MNKLALTFLTLLLSACATYRVSPDRKVIDAIPSWEEVSVTKSNKLPEGNHCFEPMMYVLTLGIIPTHCVDTYEVSSVSKDIGQVKVTTVQGWVALIMAMLPNWQYGTGAEVQNEIKDMVQNGE